MRVNLQNKTELKEGPISKLSNGEIKTIHAVYIIDRSGSMRGPKYRAAIDGVKEDIKIIRTVPDVNYTLTVIEFDQGATDNSWSTRTYSTRIHTHMYMKPIKEVLSNPFNELGADGGTPLYETVGETIDKIEREIKNGDKVVMNIFTDGEENASKGKYADHEMLRRRIAEVEEKGFTVTYQGTQTDIDRIVRELHIPISNTYAHMNTAATISMAAQERGVSMRKYSKAVASGASIDELKQGFYSKEVEENQK